MKELILLGGGASRKECPYDAEVWAVSSVLSLPDIIPANISKVFGFDLYPEVEKHLKIAKEYGIPIVSIRNYADEPYPLDEITKKFGTNYLRPSMSYMIAMAIYEGYERLKLYGTDQGPEWKYIANRPYVTLWIGMALGRGVKVEMTENSLLMDPLISEIMEQMGLEKERAYDWLNRNREKLVKLGGAGQWIPLSLSLKSG